MEIRSRISSVYIKFTFSLAEIRLCRTHVRRRNGCSAILRIFIYPLCGDAKKVQTVTFLFCLLAVLGLYLVGVGAYDDPLW